MSFQLRDAALHLAQAFGGIHHNHVPDQVSRLAAKLTVEADTICKDSLIDSIGIIVVVRKERRVPIQQLIDKYAKGPPISCLCVQGTGHVSICSVEYQFAGVGVPFHDPVVL
eukprot:scaffold2752_cov393-Prasinococcus_capsulatus_cf.AAC.18